MSEVRLANEGETDRLKEIWKLSFGDANDYVNWYFAHLYRKDKTVLVVDEGVIVSMLTMMPLKLALPAGRKLDCVMLYAVATHPNYRKRGFANLLTSFTNRYLQKLGIALSLLVPAKEELFAFYYKQGYQDGFYLRETVLAREEIAALSATGRGSIRPLAPAEYNRIRNEQLHNRVYIEYGTQEIAYQKKLSCLSGADIYAFDSQDTRGCMAVERTRDKAIIKEILVPAPCINTAVQEIAQQIEAKEYVVRMPVWLKPAWAGPVRPFGILKILGDTIKTESEDWGYLGLAFD